MFRLLYAYIRTLAYIFAGILALGGLSRCVSSDDGPPRPRQAVESDGNCLLPGVHGHAAWTGTGDQRSCVVYALDDSFVPLGPGRSNDRKASCALRHYILNGHLDEKRFVVGREWLIFPVWQAEEVCVVVVPERDWQSASHADPKAYQPDVLVGGGVSDRSSQTDLLTGRRQHVFDIPYAGDTFAVEELKDLLERAKADILQRERVYGLGDRNAVKVGVYGRASLVGQTGIAPLCVLTGNVHGVGATGARVFSVTCDEADLQVWQRRGEVQQGLTPGLRRQLYQQIGSRLVWLADSRIKGPRSCYERYSAYPTLGITYRHGLPPAAAGTVPEGVTGAQLTTVLNEGGVLGWWIEDEKAARGR